MWEWPKAWWMWEEGRDGQWGWLGHWPLGTGTQAWALLFALVAAETIVGALGGTPVLSGWWDDCGRRHP